MPTDLPRDFARYRISLSLPVRLVDRLDILALLTHRERRDLIEQACTDLIERLTTVPPPTPKRWVLP